MKRLMSSKLDIIWLDSIEIDLELLKNIVCSHIILNYTFRTKHLLHTGNVAAGNHEYPFSFQLPSKLPCSFEGSHGNVRY